MGLLSRSMEWLRGQMEEAGGVDVVYARGVYTVDLTPWLGRTVFASNLQNAARIEWGERDYLLPAEALILNGSNVKPAVGDRISETVNGTAKVFEVTRPGTGEPAWRYADPGETMLRIHVKRVT